jgi:type II secretory pathway component PulJ
MKRLARDPIRRRPGGRPGRGFTILELLIATTLTLMLMATVVTIFGAVSRSVRESRAVLEMAGRLRVVKDRLEHDLEGLTVVPAPPRRPDAGEGYLEIVEGPWGVVEGPMDGIPPTAPPTDASLMRPVNIDTGLMDTTVADFDDVLMFTSRNRKVPFVGRYRDGTIRAEEAEVMWFVRGNTLYRRVLLIAPHEMYNIDVNPAGGNGVIDAADLTDADGNFHAFHEWYDLSARPELDPTGTVTWGWKLNTLGDLTKRDNRFAHRVVYNDAFPWSIRRWGQLRLPTLSECSHPAWMTWGNPIPDPDNRDDPARLPSVTPSQVVDLWAEPHPWPEVDRELGTLRYSDGRYSVSPDPDNVRLRIAEDVMLTNVIGFDVKVWDPTAPLFQGVNDNGTPLDLTDDSPTPDLPSPDVIVKPGDPGYILALAHWVNQRATNPAPWSSPYIPRATGAYVDIGYGEAPILQGLLPADPATATIVRNLSSFSHSGDSRSGLVRTYDTWSSHYEHDAWSEAYQCYGPGTDGFDNNGNGIVDEPAEWQFTPPYFAPLRGIQVEIRTFDPDSRQVRSVTLVMDFLK